MWVPKPLSVSVGPARETCLTVPAAQVLRHVATSSVVLKAMVWAWFGRALWEQQADRTAHDALAELVWRIHLPNIAPRAVHVLLKVMKDYYYMGASPPGPVLHGKRVVLAMFRSWARRAAPHVNTLTLSQVPNSDKPWVTHRLKHFLEKECGDRPGRERALCFDYIVMTLGYASILSKHDRFSKALQARCLDAERVGGDVHILNAVRHLY